MAQRKGTKYTDKQVDQHHLGDESINWQDYQAKWVSTEILDERR